MEFLFFGQEFQNQIPFWFRLVRVRGSNNSLGGILKNNWQIDKRCIRNSNNNCTHSGSCHFGAGYSHGIGNCGAKSNNGTNSNRKGKRNLLSGGDS